MNDLVALARRSLAHGQPVDQARPTRGPARHERTTMQARGSAPRRRHSTRGEHPQPIGEDEHREPDASLFSGIASACVTTESARSSTSSARAHRGALDPDVEGGPPAGHPLRKRL